MVERYCCLIFLVWHYRHQCQRPSVHRSQLLNTTIISLVNPTNNDSLLKLPPPIAVPWCLPLSMVKRYCYMIFLVLCYCHQWQRPSFHRSQWLNYTIISPASANDTDALFKISSPMAAPLRSPVSMIERYHCIMNGPISWALPLVLLTPMTVP